MDKVVLKEGREKSLLRGHPWIFSGALAEIPKCQPGELLDIYDASGAFLAQGYFHPDNSLAGRILSRQKGPIAPILKERLLRAHALRKHLFDPLITNACRVINGEGDGIPGLIIDQYDGHYVIQVHTQGIERLKPILLELIEELFQPKSIYEKSRSSARQDEGLSLFEGNHFGKTPELIEIRENGHPIFVSIPEGQKTGFFLDQRTMRALVGTLSKGRRVLNCFAYTGGFSLYAAAGGADSVVSMDCSEKACELAEKNLAPFSNHRTICTDILETPLSDADFIILDPPAFAKKRRHLDSALRAYQILNERALRAISANGLLLTSTCSHYVDEKAFQHTLFLAAQRAGRSVQILSKHLQAPDHPISLAHPEGGYLKSLLLLVH